MQGLVHGDGDSLEVVEGKKDGTISGYNDNIVCGRPECIKLGISDGEILSATFRAADGFLGLIL